MATKKLARYARGFWAEGGSWSSAGARSGPGKCASARCQLSFSAAQASPTCTVCPGLKGLCLDLGLEVLRPPSARGWKNQGSDCVALSHCQPFLGLWKRTGRDSTW